MKLRGSSGLIRQHFGESGKNSAFEAAQPHCILQVHAILFVSIGCGEKICIIVFDNAECRFASPDAHLEMNKS
jgi:hypothetical protein